MLLYALTRSKSNPHMPVLDTLPEELHPLPKKGNLTLKSVLAPRKPSSRARRNLARSGNSSAPGGPGVSQEGEETLHPGTLEHTPSHSSVPAAGHADIYDAVRTAYSCDPRFLSEARTAKYTLKDGLWWTAQGHLIVPELLDLRRAIIKELHDSPFCGHAGITKTKKLVSRIFWWSTLNPDVDKYVKECHSCQTNKASNQKPAGLLKPLAIPLKTWQVVTMDFIMALPLTKAGFTAILVVVDKLSKMVHFIPTTIQVTGEETARLYRDHVVKLHGWPERIVSDRDPRFKGKFMTELMRISNTAQDTSTAFHPQTDGQTERTNRTLEDMLRHYVDPHHDDWDQHLAMAEFAINNSWQESIKTTPFRLNYAKDPPMPLTVRQDASVPAAQSFANSLQESIKQARIAHTAASQRQKMYADRSRVHIVFNVGDQVLLNSKNIKVRNPGSPKFLPKWLGPFTIIDHCSHHCDPSEGGVQSAQVAFKLDLPDAMRIHPVFHASLLKHYKAGEQAGPPPLTFEVDGETWYTVERILQHRDTEITIRQPTKHRPKRVKLQREYLVKWLGYSDDHNSWEPAQGITEMAIADYCAYRNAPLP